MINIISLHNFQTKLNLKQANNHKSYTNNNLSPLKTDTISFQGKSAYFDGYLHQINDNEFPDSLYLNLNEVFDKLEQQKSYHRFEEFPYMLSDLLAKRTNYLGLTQGAKGFSIGSTPNPSYGFPRTQTISVFESDEDQVRKLDKSFSFNWTKEYNELEKFFDKNANNMDKIKKELPEILRRQNWIK